jgi:hypothetical protein
MRNSSGITHFYLKNFIIILLCYFASFLIFENHGTNKNYRRYHAMKALSHSFLLKGGYIQSLLRFGGFTQSILSFVSKKHSKYKIPLLQLGINLKQKPNYWLMRHTRGAVTQAVNI